MYMYPTECAPSIIIGIARGRELKEVGGGWRFDRLNCNFINNIEKLV
jgi:hypothetical protein